MRQPLSPDRYTKKMNFYLSKYSFIPPQILEPPSANLGITVVIPCFNEPGLVRSLDSLKNCTLPTCDVEVIIVINSGTDHSDKLKKQNRLTLLETKKWIENNSTGRLKFFVLFFDDLPQKHAGVGLARKIGMDEAVSRFDAINRDGIIVCFDADSSCEKNYLAEIENHFKNHAKTPGCSIRFEHPVSGNEFDQRVYDGIINYELHLHYYVMAMRYCGLPYAFHSVGSSMAVCSSAYQKQGGMNKRKAGEDFYFLHKIIALENFTELNTTCVIPSPRVSDRVPFGTGKAIGHWVNSGASVYMTYHFESFKRVRDFVLYLPHFYKCDEMPAHIEDSALGQFLLMEKFNDAVAEIRRNSATMASFEKRFFTWFDAFRLLKLIHYLRDHAYPAIPVTDAANQLLQANGTFIKTDNALALLMHLREKWK